jgi:hypothetical protein
MASKRLHGYPDIVDLLRDMGVDRRKLEVMRRQRWRKRPRCGARTRQGGVCLMRVLCNPRNGVQLNGRCRLHGGLSTGPRTAEGKAAIAASNRRRAGKTMCCSEPTTTTTRRREN